MSSRQAAEFWPFRAAHAAFSSGVSGFSVPQRLFGTASNPLTPLENAACAALKYTARWTYCLLGVKFGGAVGFKVKVLHLL